MRSENIIKWLRASCVGLIAGIGVLLSAGCVGVAGPGPVAYYDYDYYPEWDVYYYPEGHIYYWNDGGHWRSGGRLPSHYVLRDENRERLQLHTRQPWTEHQSEHSGPVHSDEHH